MRKNTTNTTNANKSTRKTTPDDSFFIPGKRWLAMGVTVSNDTRLTGLNNNDMVIGPSGAGKSGSVVLRNLLSPDGHSLIISDTKGRLHGMCAARLRRLGYTVHKIDLVDPERSEEGYNPLQFIRCTKNGHYNEKDIKTLARAICPSQDTKEPFWDQTAARYITMLIAYVLEALPWEDRTILSVCELHRSYLSGEGKALLSEWSEENPDSLASKKFRELKNAPNAERTWACIVEFANNALDPFDYEEFAPIFKQTKCFDFRLLGKEKTALFLVTSDHDDSFDRITNLIQTQIFQILIDEADHEEDGMLEIPCRLYLDDFAASARIPDFERTISIIRSRAISCTLILQSISQLAGLYGTYGAATILNNCDHLLLLGPGSDMDTANFVSTHLNRTANTVLTMNKDDAVLITRGESARIVKKIPPYSFILDDASDDESETPGKEAAYDKA